MAISILHIQIDPTEALINQKQIVTTRTRLNVTTCLYLSPNNRARSLSTLTAVVIEADTLQRIKAETLYVLKIERRALTFIFVK